MSGKQHVTHIALFEAAGQRMLEVLSRHGKSWPPSLPLRGKRLLSVRPLDLDAEVLLKLEIGPLTKSESDAISRYFILLRSSKSYLRALTVEGTQRVDLAGQPSDFVTTTERLIAVLSLLEISKLVPAAVTREELLEDLIRPVLDHEEAQDDDVGEGIG